MIIILFPVITKVPETIKALNGKKTVSALSRLARESAGQSAAKSTYEVTAFEKDALGVPKPSNGICWSVSHKPDFVAGVVSKQKVGIDLEKVKTVSDALFERIVDPDEGVQFKDQDRQIVFFRVFTAKEAVLKKTSDGIKGLSKVKIKTVVDDKNLIVQYLDKKYLVENFYFDGYLASVTKDDFDVQWTLG
ncbi:MAG: 4'-phosphopantetheinyl transferase superfamily protein [Proteobacteria bacterium]|nr:4'-phosphopantetheinyl transferase superfamily protein [Pseudomonadota bacterium]MBU1583293.1 4'-phosphopantetheinyl transferase superfamily protein [Pseudomonadota bacterium]MBU2454570.1 4'-phosphopantetheinyl transferase superfamily protein [Pseudomonadota bacterium]MBU2630019.1 4'-phosphopantetheinyl transferase superfamily protein [Pseudomonadota bacterium]